MPVSDYSSKRIINLIHEVWHVNSDGPVIPDHFDLPVESISLNF